MMTRIRRVRRQASVARSRAGRRSIELRAADPVGERIPRRLDLAVEGVEIQIHEAVRVRADGEVDRVRANDLR